MSGQALSGIMSLFGLVYFAFMAVAFIGWIVFLVAVWRLMRAHESVAESARIAIEILDAQRSQGI